MKVTITSMSGNTRNINLMTKQEVYDFIELFGSTLLPNQRVKITCDLLSIDGYLQGAHRQGVGTPHMAGGGTPLLIQHGRGGTTTMPLGRHSLAKQIWHWV